MFTRKSLQRRFPGGLGDGSSEWDVLVECVSINSTSRDLLVKLNRPLDWSILQEVAKEHGLIPLLAERLQALDGAGVPRTILESLREQRRAHAIFTLRLTAEMFRILDCVEQAGVKVLVTKGPTLSQRCYGDPGMRQYGDLDLIVHDRDIQHINEAMVLLGYSSRVPRKAIEAAKRPGEYAFRNPDTQLLIEFHSERTLRYHPKRLQIERLFARRANIAVDGRDVPVLSVEDELILISIHGAKHFWERLMWIADVAALASPNISVRWDRATEAAREMGAERILGLALLLAKNVLGAVFPESVNATIHSDAGVARLAKQITDRLAGNSMQRMGVFERAVFRLRMRGGFLKGAVYLLRLILSPTEEDWLPDVNGVRPPLLGTLRRPFRLARKHSRRPNP